MHATQVIMDAIDSSRRWYKSIPVIEIQKDFQIG
jgi:hypothetical protein